MLHGYRATCLIVTAVQLGLIERLAAGPASDEVLARALGAHLPSLRRFLRGLRAIGVVSHQEGGVGLTSMGRALLKDAPGLWHWAVLIGEEYLPAWAHLRHSVLTGEPAFEQVFGMSVWQHRAQRPELDECFNRMASRSPNAAAIATAYDFAAADLIVDVGGGHGQLLAGILARYPRARGIAFDQPHVADGAAAVLDAAGIGDRCSSIGGSFFESVPEGGDVYVLQHVLHDWSDEECVSILKNCRAAMRSSSTLLIVEHVMPDAPEDARGPVMLDLHMLAVLGGAERTRAEYEALLGSAGLDLVRCTKPLGVVDVLEAKASAQVARE